LAPTAEQSAISISSVKITKKGSQKEIKAKIYCDAYQGPRRWNWQTDISQINTGGSNNRKSKGPLASQLFRSKIFFLLAVIQLQNPYG
jgi:hypothetical protein